jgi:hypothetical protein
MLRILTFLLVLNSPADKDPDPALMVVTQYLVTKSVYNKTQKKIRSICGKQTVPGSLQSVVLVVNCLYL